MTERGNPGYLEFSVHFVIQLSKIHLLMHPKKKKKGDGLTKKKIRRSLFLEAEELQKEINLALFEIEICTL